MMTSFYNIYIRRVLAGVLSCMLVFPPACVRAQAITLPPAGEKVALSQAFQPSALSAITVDPQNQLQLQFYVTPADDAVPGDHKDEYLVLVKDFMTALTLPEDKLWVNLSPYEKDRVIDDHFGLTGMGRDLLGQDYILKQVASSLLFPEEGVGKKFWEDVYRLAQDKFGTTDIPVDTFNKVWIMPDVAEVYQQGTSAVVLKSRLKVMLESDYLATTMQPVESVSGSQDLAKQVLRDIIIPVLEKEVNEGKNFARLRQIYNALILAAWYKKSMRETFLGQSYADKDKVKGIEQDDPAENQRIYSQYVEAFRRGAFNYIKEEVDRYSGELIPRKYLSGGVTTGEDFSEKVLVVHNNMSAGERKDFSEKTFNTASTRFEEIAKTPDIESLPSILKEIYEANEAYTKIYNSKRNEAFTEEEGVLVKGYESRLITLVEYYIDNNVLSGEAERKELVMREIVRPLLNGGVSGARSLLFSGAYTDQASRYFLALAKLARKDTPVPFYEIFDLLGLTDPNLKAALESKMRGLRSPEEYRVFYEEIFNKLFDAQSSFKKEGYTYIKELINLREKDPVWNQSLKATADKPNQKRIGEMIERQKMLFPQTRDDVSKMLKGVAAKFVRVKEYDSIMGKLYRDGVVEYAPGTFETSEKKLSFVNFFDLTGGRLIINGDLKAIEKKIIEFDAKTITYEEWKTQIEAEETALKKKPKRDSEAEKALAYKKENFISLHGEYVVFRKENRYLSQLGNDKGGHYRGTNYVIATRVGKNTVEVQFHGLVTLLYDVDHEFIYKRKENPLELEDEVLKTIWLSHIVLGLKYVSEGNKKNRKKVLDFLNDKAESVASVDAAPTGGIDIRNVEGAIDVQGENVNFSRGVPEMFGEDIDGLSPEILSVTPVQGLPFLREQSAPQGIFSRN